MMLDSLKRGLKQVLEDAAVHAAPTLGTVRPLDVNGESGHVSLDVKSTKLVLRVRDASLPLSAREARAVAAALLEAAAAVEQAGKSSGAAT